MHRIRHPAQVFLVALGALLVPATLAVVATSLIDRPEPSSPIPPNPTSADQPRPTVELDTGIVAHVNSTGDYAFAYPTTWLIDETGGVTRLENPGGDIVASFGPGAPGDIATASGRLVSSILGIDGTEIAVNDALTGTSWEQIDGSRSLIVSGVTEGPDGRSVRFLAITVRAVSRNYSISVLVPAGSDPTRVLPTIEAIVSSFEVLESEIAA
ncbi:MAG: hypothetical protein L0206_10765 [Actinobacteria bacterium]|nr:hypothetical protein [Actinomycetota bacterium]